MRRPTSYQGTGSYSHILYFPWPTSRPSPHFFADFAVKFFNSLRRDQSLSPQRTPRTSAKFTEKTCPQQTGTLPVQLQMLMKRRSQFEETLSNLMKSQQ